MAEAVQSKDEIRWERDRIKQAKYEERMRLRSQTRALDFAKRSVGGESTLSFEDVRALGADLSEDTRAFRAGGVGLVVLREDSACFLWVSSAGVDIAQEPWVEGTRYAWDDVTAFEIDGAEAIQNKVSFQRVALLGVWALAAQQREGTVLITLEIRGRSQPIWLSCEGFTAPELRQTLAKVLPREAARGSGDALVDLLERLAALHASGALTDEEYAQAKAKALSD